jgi:CBS domain containing-hemolysin-like protein
MSVQDLLRTDRAKVSIYVLFSAVMEFLIGFVILTLAFADPEKLGLLKILLAAVYVLFFGSVAWFYRASTHLVANENGINKYPWMKQAAY